MNSYISACDLFDTGIRHENTIILAFHFSRSLHICHLICVTTIFWLMICGCGSIWFILRVKRAFTNYVNICCILVLIVPQTDENVKRKKKKNIWSALPKINDSNSEIFSFGWCIFVKHAVDMFLRYRLFMCMKFPVASVNNKFKIGLFVSSIWCGYKLKCVN